MNNQKKKVNRKSNVIPLVLNASFYHTKAMEAAERNNFTKALRFFTRAVEIEPDNPVHHCNVSGMLAELGRYEESNHILHYVLNNVAPNMYDCYFYMANNYAYLHQFEEAERMAVRYLRYDPDGFYVEDAEELLEHISYELGRQTRELDEEDYEQIDMSERNDRARQLLEQGKLNEATKVLKDTIVKYPDFLPARNNLALTYYYSGKMSEAMREVEQVLDREEHNMHALCNLALFLKELGEEERLAEILDGLTKLYPMHSENIYKLATTLGILGKHDVCYRLFLSLYRDHGIHTPSLVHQIAVAAYNKNDSAEAELWWQKLSTFEGAYDISRYYLDMLKQRTGDKEPLSYRYPTRMIHILDAEQKLLTILRKIIVLLRKNWREEYAHFLPEAENRLSCLAEQPLSRLQKVRKLEALAAVIEYSVLSEIVHVSKKEIAERYKISLSTFNRYIDEYPCHRS